MKRRTGPPPIYLASSGTENMPEGRSEERLHVIVREAVHEGRLTDPRLTASFGDLAQHPLEILLGPVTPGQDVHGVLDRDGSDALKPASDLGTQVVGLGRDRMDEEEPGVVNWLLIWHCSRNRIMHISQL